MSVVPTEVLDHRDAPPVPFVLTPDDLGRRLALWINQHRDELDALLLEHGALLFRRFRVNGASGFEEVTAAQGTQPLEYRNRSTPRSVVRGRVYTSTEYPPHEHIPLHNENAYTSEWAERLFFFCIKAASEGGETPIADSAAIYRQIPESIREEFERRGVRYVRNYGHLDLPWQEVFQTEDRREVEAFCEQTGTQYEWDAEGHLRTWQICPAVQTHPKSHLPVWFNQAHLFHVSNLSAEVRESLMASVGEGGLPRNAYFGDGGRISEEYLEEIRAAYEANEVTFPWRSGDILLLDNMRYAHGRRPFVGERRVLVAMTHPHGGESSRVEGGAPA